MTSYIICIKCGKDYPFKSDKWLLVNGKPTCKKCKGIKRNGKKEN